MKTVLSDGSSWPLAPLDDQNRLLDIDDALAFGNHKGANQQPELLLKLVSDNIIRGFALPLPLDKIRRIPGVLLAPLNIQLQKTINERGEIIPKNRMTHDQSWKRQLGTSVNSRVDEEKLVPCYFGQALKRIINWCVAARTLPGKKNPCHQVGREGSFPTVPPQHIDGSADLHPTARTSSGADEAASLFRQGPLPI